MQLEFVGDSRQDGGNRAANASRLINFYREAVNGSETQFVLRSVLGQSAFATFQANARDAIVDGDYLYLLASGTLSKINTAGSAVATCLPTDSADSTLSANSGIIAMAVGGVYKTWDGTSLATPATGNFADIGSVDYVKGYTVYTQKDGRKWGWSDLLDATTLPALNFATAEARDDDCLRVVAVADNAWIFKERSIEVWYPTGQSGASAFYPLGGGVTDIGLKAYSLVTKFPGGAFFVGNDNVAYVTFDASIKGVSDGHPGVTYSLESESPQACFYYEDSAHKFLAITFANRPAWVLDVTTGEWHERAEGYVGPWTASHAVKFDRAWLTIHADGDIHTMLANGTDVDGPLIRRAISRALYTETDFRVSRVEILGRTGWSDLGRDGEVWLRVSKDRGHTWSDEMWRSIGDLGDYGKRVEWRALGQFRSLTAEFGVSDPFDMTINATAMVDIA